MLKTGTIVDATIIAAPSSTKNKEGQRDPEMHQTKKGSQNRTPSSKPLPAWPWPGTSSPARPWP